MELGRLSFTERIKSRQAALLFIKKKIFGPKDSPFFQSFIRGEHISKAEFLEFVEKKRDDVPVHLQEWVNQVKKLLKGDLELASIIYVNWCRLKDMNLWDHPSLLIGKGKGPWVEQWFPWIPLLDNRIIRYDNEGIIMGRNLQQIQHSPIKTTQGFSHE